MLLRDNIVQRKVRSTDQLLHFEVAELVHVVSIIDFDDEILILLELEFDVDGGHELWVHAVEDHLGLADLGPLVSRFHFPNDTVRIRLRLLVQVR